MKNLLQLSLFVLTIIVLSNCTETKTEDKISQVQQQIEQQVEQVDSTEQTEKSSPKAIDNYQKVAPRTVYDTTNWVRILDIDPTIVEDMRYATTDNFVEEIMYNCAACYLRPEAAEAVGKAHQILKEKGYGGLKMLDCYRPRPIQQKLWDKVPDARYVTPHSTGS